MSACSSGNPAGPGADAAISIGMEYHNGAPIAGVTVVKFNAIIAPKPSTVGTVTWRFTDDNSTATGTSVTHVFAPRLSGGPDACQAIDPTSGRWVVYQAAATFAGFSFKDQDIALPVATRTLTGTWIDEPASEILSITAAGNLICGTSRQGANARIRNVAGTIDGDLRILTWDRVPDADGDCVEHHRAVIDPNLARLVGDVVTVDPSASGGACGVAASNDTWTRCEADVDCTIR